MGDDLTRLTGSVLWCDGEGYSSAPEKQRTFLVALNVAAKQVPWKILRDNGDGLGMVFDGDPALALEAVKTLHQATQSTGIALRYGIHFGEIISTEVDPLNNEKPHGDVMNLGARVMAAGRGGHVLLSHDYVMALSERRANLTEFLFDLGEVQVKAQRVHVYNYWDGIIGRPDSPIVAKPSY